MTTALYPGSFDPPTNGHLDVIERAASIFDHLVVGVVGNPSKSPMFTAAERVDLLTDLVAGFDHVEVGTFDGLLVDYARHHDVHVVVKGLRAVSDFDYELQMAQMNYTLDRMETLFLPTNPSWGYLSSSLVKEVARLGGAVDELVPPAVAAAIKEKLS